MRMTVLLLAVALVACGSKPKPKHAGCDADKDCPTGKKCFNHVCSDCAVDADCPAGQKCAGGACQAANSCATDADCPDGKVCKDHVCTACTADTQCAGGGKCVAGGCKAANSCDTDDQCAEDEDCVNHVCTKGGGGGGGGGGETCDLQPVYFDFDSNTLNDSGKSALDADADCIQKNPGHAVDLRGNTDERGTEEYNLALSDRRAQIVLDYLTRQNIDAGTLKKIPLGESQATGKDEAGWAKDRRVDLLWR